MKVTYVELEKTARNHSGLRHTMYCVRSSLDGSGVAECGLVAVTRKVFLKTARDLLRSLEARGTRIELTIPAPGVFVLRGSAP